MAAPWIADLWFDPSCEYTWRTSRWLVEVARVRPVEPRWHVMSLSILNEHRDDDPEDDPEGYLWIPARVCAAVQATHGQEALGRFYAALWSPEAGAEQWMGSLERALELAGLPRELAEAGLTTAYDDVLRASHDEGVRLVGTHVGTPVVAVTDPDGERVAFFGPVLSEVPRSEAAAMLWDGVLRVAATPGFHELRGAPAR